MSEVALISIIVISFLLGYVIGESKREIKQFIDEWFNNRKEDEV